MEKGKFIVFEGINGCGKGTQIISFADELMKNRDNTLFLNREPNNFDDNGKEARRILNSDGNPYVNNVEALRHFSLNRIYHNSIFGPMLEKGIDVVCDRYYHSTFSFQGAQGIENEVIAKFNKDKRIRIPDLTYIVDVPVEEAFERLGKRHGDRRQIDRGEPDRRKFDRDFQFMEKVRKTYLNLGDIVSEHLGDKSIVIIDGTGSPDQVHERIMTEYKDK